MSSNRNKFSRDPIKGMDDFYPSDMRLVNFICDVLRDVAELYCYEEYETPLLEPIEIFEAKSSTELVNEQSYIVEKKEGVRLILRPEITPSLARMVAKKNQELKKPIRWYSIPKCYRYEDTQKGRRREFLQFNLDILGEDNLYGELEIFNIIIDLLTNFGATAEQFQIYYNNRRFIDAVCQFILNVPKSQISLVYKILDKSDKLEEKEFEKLLIDSFQNENIVQGILKIKESKSLEELLKKFEDIPEDFYKSKGYIELINLDRMIKDAGISEYCSFSSKVVRGLDYYTGTVFEVFDTGKENIRAIFGGGRYDDLLSMFSEESLSGIGFGMGILMLSLFLKTYDLLPDYINERDNTDTVYIISINENAAPYALKIAKMIRDEGLPCIVDYKFKNLKNQLSKASELGVLITLIIGDKEAEENRVTIKNLATNVQKTVNIKGLIDEIYKILDAFEEKEDSEEN